MKNLKINTAVTNEFVTKSELPNLNFESCDRLIVDSFTMNHARKPKLSHAYRAIANKNPPLKVQIGQNFLNLTGESLLGSAQI